MRTLLDAIDPQFGIIRRVSEHRRLMGDLPIHIYSTELSDTSVFSPAVAGPHCGGAGLSREEALGAAIGEALERYCLGWNQHHSWIVASISNVKGKTCDLSRLPLLSNSATDNKQFVLSHETPIDWVVGVNQLTKTKVLVPSNLIHVPYVPLGGDVFDRPISSGAALGFSYEDAVLSGLLEVIERDSFMLWWLARRVAVRVPESDVAASGVSSIIKAATRTGGHCSLFYLPTDFGIPVVCAICRSSRAGQGPSLSVGAAARLNGPAAIRKAVVEMAHTRAWQISMMHARDATASFQEQDINTISDHPRLWTWFGSDRQLWFEDLTCEEAQPRFDSPSSLDELLAILASHSYEVLSVDITTNDIRSLGAFVVRTIVPGLHPLEVGSQFHFHSTRLKEVLGLELDANTEAVAFRMNPDPHPFP